MTYNIIDKIKSKECYQKITDIAEYIQYLEVKNEVLSKELKAYNKDSEIQKLKNEIRSVRERSLCIMTNEEFEKLHITLTDHRNQCEPHNYHYEVYPNKHGDSRISQV